MKPLPDSADDTYALAQGPFTLKREEREAEEEEADQSTRVASKGKRQNRDGVFLIMNSAQDSVFSRFSKTFKRAFF